MLCWALSAVPCGPEALGDGGMDPGSPPLALICCCAATSLAAAYSCWVCWSGSGSWEGTELA